jgi:glycine/D-amino acid oxidase-like deaminating enzyme
MDYADKSPRPAGSISRRAFLEGLAVLPLAARLGAAPPEKRSAPRIAVIGAGAFGGWTALHLRNAGASVVLLDSLGAGNTRSSSGGKSRVIRAIYGPDRIYTEMVKRAFDLWQNLDGSTPERLYVETGALWMHRRDDAYVRSAVPILEDLGFDIDKIPLADAARRYPQINFRGIESVWFERRAGALLAQRACVEVRDAFQKAGGTYRTAHVMPGAIANGSLSSLRLDDGSTIEADIYVFACGPWLGKLFPEVLGKSIRPTRQEVYYFGTPSARYDAGRLPVWIDFGERIVYGVPDVQGRALKVADDTRGEAVDPNTVDRVPSKEGPARARRFLAERFPGMADAPMVAAWVCQYENSPDGHLIIDSHPEAKNTWLVGGGSGHGFKLAPVVGEITAAGILAGKEVPSTFRLDRLRGIQDPSTQFERKSGSSQN